MQRNLVIIILFYLNTFAIARAQNEFLFFQNQAVEFTLTAPFSDLLRQRLPVYISESKNKQNLKALPGTLALRQGQEMISASVLVSLRGHSSLSEDQCDFPKLKIQFLDPKPAYFAQQTELNIGTHCSVRGGFSPLLNRSWSGTSPHREALAYRMLHELGVPTLQSQSAFAKYIDSTDGRVYGEHRQAFFLESGEDASRRLGGEVRYSSQEHFANPQKQSKALFKYVKEAEQTDLVQVATVLLFENLIQNNDWNLRIDQDEATSTFLWNLKIIKLASANAYNVLPFDFDLSELVSGYARSCRSNTYYEYLVGAENYKQAVELFKNKKQNLYALIKLLPDAYSQRLALKKLDLFYLKLEP